MAGITQQDNTWQLSGRLIVNDITAVLRQAQQLTIKSDTYLDFANVEEVDTSAISLILELQRQASKASASVLLRNPPESLTTLMALYGVEGFIASA